MAKNKKNFSGGFDKLLGATTPKKEEDKKKKVERPKTSDTNKSVSSTIDDAEQEKLNSKKRVKLTTMINPSLRDKLKLIAIKKRVNFSDILEDAIKDYLK